VGAGTPLPDLDQGPLLTDGGLETTLIFHRGIDLPQFAAFTLLGDDDGERLLREYFESYLRLAAEHGTGFVLESPTWRASPRWAAELGVADDELERLNRRSIELLSELRDEHASKVTGPILISGCVGPQDDGYQPAQLLSADEAEDYHSMQVETFADTAADLVTMMTITYADEAVGFVRAAVAAEMPSVVSFTVETDGRLPSGQALGDAIEQVEAETSRAPAWYMINCAHPTHFAAVLDGGWVGRVRGLRANASTMSHAELDEAEDLDDGDPVDLGRRYAELAQRLPALGVLGGCCGTDDRHVAAIAAAWSGSEPGT
jgi:S-methylmethionine-dependent homocysteine/selenocysteine methylase